MSAENIPTFKLVLGKHIVACYLATSVSDHSSLNFLIDNIYLVLDGLTPQLLASRFVRNLSSLRAVGDGGTGKTTFVKVNLELLSSTLIAVLIFLICPPASLDWRVREEVHWCVHISPNGASRANSTLTSQPPSVSRSIL